MLSGRQMCQSSQTLPVRLAISAESAVRQKNKGLFEARAAGSTLTILNKTAMQVAAVHQCSGFRNAMTGFLRIHESGDVAKGKLALVFRSNGEAFTSLVGVVRQTIIIDNSRAETDLDHALSRTKFFSSIPRQS